MGTTWREPSGIAVVEFGAGMDSVATVSPKGETIRRAAPGTIDRNRNHGIFAWFPDGDRFGAAGAGSLDGCGGNRRLRFGSRLFPILPKMEKEAAPVIAVFLQAMIARFYVGAIQEAQHGFL